MPSSLLTTDVSRTRLRAEGIRVSKDKIFEKILDLLSVKPLAPKEFESHLNLNSKHIYRAYLIPLLEQGKITKLAGTGKYKLSDQDITVNQLRQHLLSEAQIFETPLFKRWDATNHSKGKIQKRIRFARICLGLVNPKFKIHPDSFTAKYYQEIVPNMVDAILEVSKNKTKLNSMNKQSIRHAIIYGLGVNLSEVQGYELRIDGETEKPKIADLHITAEQVKQAKEILLNDPIKTWFLKFGVKGWAGMRPSTFYIVETNALRFYDRTVEFSEFNGKKTYKEEIIERDKQMLLLRPDLADIIKIGKFTHRACTFEVHEHKTDSDFRKYIFDEEFVIPLEKYWKQRTFEKKKYLFWDDNATVFRFEDYTEVVKNEVAKDNKYFKELFLKLGFVKEDFGIYFKANYGFRHFAIQMLLQYTDYDFDFVATMFHEDVATLKKWYGKQTAEYHEKKTKEIVFA